MADHKSSPPPDSWAHGLFDEAEESGRAPAPLDPREFGQGASDERAARRHVDPTERIDVASSVLGSDWPAPEVSEDSDVGEAPVGAPWARRADAWSPEAQEAPEPSPPPPARRAATPDPASLSGDLAAPPLPAAPPEELDLGLPIGSGPAAAPPVDAAPPAEPARPVERAAVEAHTVAIVHEDRTAGARTATPLLAAGYACRVVSPADWAAVAAEGGVDVALVEVPPDFAEGERLARLEAAMGRVWPGPIVLCSSGPLPSRSPEGRPGLVRPLEADALVVALESARATHAPFETASSGDAGGRPIAALGAPSATRAASMGPGFSLTDNLVRALALPASGGSARGRVRRMSHEGDVILELTQALPAGARVEVELTLVDGRRATVAGQVADATPEGAPTRNRLELRPDEAQVDVLRRFVDEARDVTQPSIEQVRIREVGGAAAGAGGADVPDLTALRGMFERAVGDLDDDAPHQAFIQACLRAQQIPIAVQWYRELREASPDDPRVMRYLNQVGTILGFVALRKEDAEVDEGMPRSLKWGLAAFVFAALMLVVLVFVMG